MIAFVAAFSAPVAAVVGMTAGTSAGEPAGSERKARDPGLAGVGRPTEASGRISTPLSLDEAGVEAGAARCLALCRRVFIAAVFTAESRQLSRVSGTSKGAKKQKKEARASQQQLPSSGLSITSQKAFTFAAETHDGGSRRDDDGNAQVEMIENGSTAGVFIVAAERGPRPAWQVGSECILTPVRFRSVRDGA